MVDVVKTKLFCKRKVCALYCRKYLLCLKENGVTEFTMSLSRCSQRSHLKRLWALNCMNHQNFLSVQITEF